MDIRLYKDENKGLILTDGRQELQADLSKMIRRLRPDNLRRELIVKAAGKAAFRERTAGTGGAAGEDERAVRTRPLAIDATAGFGEDSLLLAAAGFEVRLYEYDEIIAALLADALERAGRIPELSEAVSRMTLFEQDSIQALGALEEAPDLVYLDPMFPERQKSGLVKKKFQLLQQLERPCADEEALLEAALKASPGRIIIKRPLKGAFLAGRKPDYSLNGKTVRYDVIINSNC